MDHISKIKALALTCLVLLLLCVNGGKVAAQIGDLGFFGGVSEGRRLPRTTEQLLAQTGRTNARNRKDTLNYSEIVFMDGRPVRFDGLIDITVNGSVKEDTPVGSFIVNYRVYPVPGSAPGEVVVNRTANFRVNYRIAGSQVIYDYDIIKNNWRETLLVNGTLFTLNARKSSYGISVIEDRTPGIAYYRGDVSGNCSFSAPNIGEVRVETAGSFYGCSSVWANTETHRNDMTLIRDDWSMMYQIRPSVTVNKVLQYTQNEPTAISFVGNFREVMQSLAGIKYSISVIPMVLWDEPLSGTVSLPSVNTFEQLPAADLTFLRGDASEDSIARLFAMQVLTGAPRDYQPNQAITRGQFVTALAKAVKLPIEQPSLRAKQPLTYVFSDVSSARAEYPYIMAAYKTGIAVGRDNGMFYFDYPIERQEAFTIMVKTLGLSRLAPNPTTLTPFLDDGNIAGWAKREIVAAQLLGLIAPDDAGNINPTAFISKGEAATLLNSIIEFMRVGIVSDYADQIVNLVR